MKVSFPVALKTVVSSALGRAFVKSVARFGSVNFDAVSEIRASTAVETKVRWAGGGRMLGSVQPAVARTLCVTFEGVAPIPTRKSTHVLNLNILSRTRSTQ